MGGPARLPGPGGSVVTAAEHLDRAEEALASAERCYHNQKFDRVAAMAALASAHIAMARTKEGAVMTGQPCAWPDCPVTARPGRAGSAPPTGAGCPARYGRT